MNPRKLGHTGLYVSPLCLGTMHFGWKTGEDASFAILDTFREAGGNFIQAASSTGTDDGFDRLATAPSEKHVGSWMHERGVPRESLVLATRLILRDRAPGGRSLGEVIRTRCEASLQQMRTDHLDLLMVEWNAAVFPLEETIEALVPLVWSGKVRALGASGSPAWRLMAARAFAGSRSLPQLHVAQHDYSLIMRRHLEPELEEFCRETRTAFLARSPLAGGFLLGEVPGRRTWIHAGRAAWLRERYSCGGSANVRDRLDAVAVRRGTSVAQTALAWVLARESVSAAVVGVTSSAQLRDLMKAAHAPLSDDDLSRLSENGSPRETASPEASALHSSNPARRIAQKANTAPLADARELAATSPAEGNVYP